MPPRLERQSGDTGSIASWSRDSQGAEGAMGNKQEGKSVTEELLEAQ